MPPMPPDGLAVAARKRRRIWGSPREMSESLTGRGAFTHWPREAVERYVRYGLNPTGRLGEWQLACDPEVEAWCFEHAATVDPWPEMAQASQPTLILRAGEKQGHGSPTGQNAVEVFPQRVRDRGGGLGPLHPDAPSRRGGGGDDHGGDGLLSRNSGLKPDLPSRMLGASSRSSTSRAVS